uniref:RIKEN cDNA 1700030J22 gene n=1 Tax=Jaculus jaculus TaxID=51337 RepID=A0A8C5L1L6_JACJA
MDLCQESETNLENSENDESQSTEETQLTLTCPDERSERNHVCCLLNISDITLAEDERVNELVVGTGWGEAVRGWGKTSPTACIWLRKKAKKARAGESTTSSCLVCANLSQGSLEARLPLDAGKWDARAEAEAVCHEKTWSSLSQTQGLSQVPSIASREPNKICFPTCGQGEKKCLQIKEFIWCMEDWANPEAVNNKVPKNSSGGVDRGLHISDFLTSKALMVLPPLKGSPPSSWEVLNKKNKNSFWQSEEKVLRVAKEECVACSYGLKTIDGKGEKRQLEPAQYLKATDTLPFPSPVAQTSLLAESQKCCLGWSLLPEKNPVCPPNPNSVPYLATLQFLQKQGVQSYRAKFKAKESRPPRNTHKHIFTEAKQENRSQTVETKVLSRSLLPSLTVSRVIIPMSTHRVL